MRGTQCSNIRVGLRENDLRILLLHVREERSVYCSGVK